VCSTFQFSLSNHKLPCHLISYERIGSHPMSSPKDYFSQLSAIAWLRWRLFTNSLRSTRGALEFTSRVLVSFAFAIAGFGGAFGMCVGAYFFLGQGKPELLAVLLWPVFIFWQFFPIMATAFTDNPDSTDLLRFPLSYPSYFLVRLAYGAFDPATDVGGLWCLGILAGIGFAKAALLPWAFAVLLAFAAFNLLFMQMVFAWVERWLAQRRTRELMGVLFVLLMLSFQLLGPLAGHFGRRSRPDLQRFIAIVVPAQAILPPGLAADAITRGIYPQWPAALSSFGLLCAFVLTAAYCLHVRLRAQYRGENLSEVAGASALPKDHSLRLGWNLRGIAPPVAAVFEKEIRYLSRSAPMLLTLIMPIFVLIVFRLGPMNSARHSGVFLMRTPDMAFPAAAAYTLLMLTNLAYNNFGADAGGIQFFYAAPVSFREIVLAKNLTHASILAVEVIVAWIAVSFFYRPPSLDITVATLAGLLFAAPVNFTAGNLLSLYSPKKLDYSKFGRQRAAQITVLISLMVQLFVVSVGVGAFWLARHYGSFWIASALLLFLAAISLSVYGMILSRIDHLALEKRETLVAELCRA
jgi:ABC-2 type transport system permease protein